jgi:hypothetical protein
MISLEPMIVDHYIPIYSIVYENRNKKKREGMREKGSPGADSLAS